MRMVLAALAMLATAGCASLLAGLYDEAAYEECDRSGGDVSGCYDRVEQNRRERDRQH